MKIETFKTKARSERAVACIHAKDSKAWIEAEIVLIWLELQKFGADNRNTRLFKRNGTTRIHAYLEQKGKGGNYCVTGLTRKPDGEVDFNCYLIDDKGNPI